MRQCSTPKISESTIAQLKRAGEKIWLAVRAQEANVTNAEGTTTATPKATSRSPQAGIVPCQYVLVLFNERDLEFQKEITESN